MKKILLSAIIVAIAIATASGAFAATTSTPVGVTGSVSGTCTVFLSGTTLDFVIDPSLAGPISAARNNDTQVKCTNGHPFTVTAASLNAGGPAASCTGAGITGTLRDAGANTINYAFTCANGTGSGFGVGTEKNLSIAASVAAAQYQNAVVSATYADTVTVTITY